MNTETKIVYFDTNVFDHIERRYDISDWDVYILERAIKDEKIAIVLSFLNLEEILFLVQKQPERASARINLILRLANLRLFIKSQEIVIGDEIHSYAFGTPAISPFCNFEPYMELVIRNASDPSRVDEVKELLDEVRRAKDKFKRFLEDGKKILLPHAKKIGAKSYKFDKYWEFNSVWLAESLVEKAGVLKKCRERGIDGLLKLKCVRLAVGANLSLMYSHHFENIKPQSGDSRDILHAVLGSSADVFVTHDNALAKVLRRVPIEGFRVDDIHYLVNALDRRGPPQWT